MTQEAVEKVLGRLLTDDVFRHRAKDSLLSACLEAGCPLSVEELRLVGRLDLRLFESAARSLDSGIKRFGICDEAQGR